MKGTANGTTGSMMNGTAAHNGHANSNAPAASRPNRMVLRRRKKKRLPSSSCSFASSPTLLAVLLSTAMLVGLYVGSIVQQLALLEMHAAANANDHRGDGSRLSSGSLLEAAGGAKAARSFLRKQQRPSSSGRRRRRSQEGGASSSASATAAPGDPSLSTAKTGPGEEGQRPPDAKLSAAAAATTERANGATSSSSPSPSSSYWTHPVIHIINTRFMQGQSDLLHLAEARLVLFEKFCLPTMVRQSVYNFTDFDPTPTGRRVTNSAAVVAGIAAGEGEVSEDEDGYLYTDPPFLWIIKVDPNLPPSILSRMINLVKSHREIYVVGSNVNFGIGIKSGKGWRGGQAGSDVLENADAGRVHSGDVEMLRRAHEMREDRIVLETRLDADDGLNVLYLERIQRDALEFLSSDFDDSSEENGGDEQEMGEGGAESAAAAAAAAAADRHAARVRSRPDRNEADALAERRGSAQHQQQQNGPGRSRPQQQQQQQQQQRRRPHPPVPPGRARWMYWCPLNHVAWDPNPPDEDPDPAGGTSNSNSTVVTPYGTFIPWKSPHGCVTAGLTVGSSVGVAEGDIPRFPHQTIVERIRGYGGGTGGGGEPDQQGECGLPNRTRCLRLVTSPKMGALRSRTPTSAGMRNVVTGSGNKHEAHAMMEIRAKDPKVRKSMWKVMTHYFAVDEAVATEVNAYVRDHFVDIVRDNLRGQCTRGHSCKVSAKEELQRLLDVADRGGTVEVVGGGGGGGG